MPCAENAASEAAAAKEKRLDAKMSSGSKGASRRRCRRRNTVASTAPQASKVQTMPLSQRPAWSMAITTKPMASTE